MNPTGAPGRPAAEIQGRPKPNFGELDFNLSPYIAIWEVTQACDLACVHCRAEARPWRDERELSTEEGLALLEEVRKFGPILFVLSGGDPLYRPDIFTFIEHGNRLGLRMTITPAGTKRVTREVMERMKDCGLSGLAVSLDGHDAKSHDGFRRVPGSFEWTMNCIRFACDLGLPVQVNTTVTRYNQGRLRQVAEVLRGEGIYMWSAFFLVPVGRGAREDMVSARKGEEIFHLLYDLSKEMPFSIKTTAAQHYRRVVIQRARAEGAGAAPGAGRGEVGGEKPESLARRSTPDFSPGDGLGRPAKGVNDGNGFVFISHTGEVFPSGFLPLRGGNVRERSAVDIYRNSPLFRQLRDYAQLKGKCGWCDFREVCGGSRARSYAVTGDYMASEPCCAYKPPKPGKRERSSRH
ncbi:MAG: TIGR04053 family radical SAM/SPASM domain-containing protein [Nitrospinota bacterium]